MEHFDGFAPLRNALKHIAGEREDWAGIPMPLDGERLVIEPRYPMAKELSAMGRKDDDDPDDELVKVRNLFWSARLRRQIAIYEMDGKIHGHPIGGVHHFKMDLHTLGCSEAWGIEQESKAVKLLATLVRHHQMKHYLLTGMFLERSKRSGLTYVFRRLRPTVCVDARDEEKETRILACLCMHPIGYYENTWAGAMCPTDDVVAHLMLMRGDEHMYWKRCNQIPPDRPQAGL